LDTIISPIPGTDPIPNVNPGIKNETIIRYVNDTTVTDLN
jgi:hypothetical protein